MTKLLIIVKFTGRLLKADESLEALRAEQFQMVPGPIEHFKSSCRAKRFGTQRIGWIRPKRCADYSATRCKRSSRPPDVDGRKIPWSYALLTRCVRRNTLDRQVHF